VLDAKQRNNEVRFVFTPILSFSTFRILTLLPHYLSFEFVYQFNKLFFMFAPYISI